MNILITGTNGFIGKNLKNKLSDEYNIFTFEESDIEGDWKSKLSNIFNKGVVCVFHVGACSDTLEQKVNYMMLLNYEVTKHITDLCVEYKVPLIYSSSAANYGTNDEYPSNLYGWSKYVGEGYVISNGGIGLRYFNVYGPHEDHKGDQASPVTKFIKQVQEDGEIKVFRTKASRDFVHVEDVCEVHYRMLHHDDSGIFNVGTGTSVSFKDIADKMAENSGAKVKQISMPEKLKGQYQKFTQADISKLTAIIGEMEWKQVLECI